MRDLISIFTYCPDDRRKKILYSFLESIQHLRDRYEILLVSHSEVPELCFGMVDYFYYDSKNTLITDFDYTNKFWFREGSLGINSSLVYSVSTHLAIYRLIYYVMNFSKSMGFKKIHLIEYDIKMDNIGLIDEVNDLLSENDNVMFKDDEDGWVWGVYFATNTEKWTIDECLYDENKILEDLKKVENRMTEYVTPKFLSGENRNILYRKLEDIDKDKKCQHVDEHQNSSLKWSVPLVEYGTDKLNFFIFNEIGGEYIIDLFVNNRCITFVSNDVGIWSLSQIGNFSEVQTLEIFVNKKLKNKINFTDLNRQSFIDNNFFKYS